jgi:small subunit ribosomal protein S2
MDPCVVELPKFSIQDLFDAGVHFGHKTSRWNPGMSPYIHSAKNGLHVIDLCITQKLLKDALMVLYRVAKRRGNILFVGTKPSIMEVVAENAVRCGQYYVNHRWLGGTLTNWKTISRSIKKLENIERVLLDESSITSYTKKELLGLDKERHDLSLSFSGIRKMKNVPDLLVVLDCIKAQIAVMEARKLHIPVLAIVDTNADPRIVDYRVPGNDDSINSVKLYMKLFSDAVLAGSHSNSGREEKG